MNILNILGIVSAGQKNVAAGQVSSVSTAAPEQRSLFLPMLLQLFAGSATKTRTPAFSQEPLNETMQPSNDSRQTTKLAANRLSSSNNSAGTGLEFLTNGIAPLGAVFATIQNMQRADEPKAVPYGTEVGMKNGRNSERTLATRSLSAEAVDDSRTAAIEEGVVSVVSDTPQNAGPASPDAQVAANNLPLAVAETSSSTEASIVVPQMVIGETSLNGSLPLAGFELTESGVSPAISEMVQSPSPAGATAQPVVKPDLHIDEVAKTLSPTLAATKAEGDDFDLNGLRQPPVRSTDSNVVLPQDENNGNRAVAAVPSSPASPSLKPTVQVGDVELNMVLPQNGSSSNRSAVAEPMSTISSPSLKSTLTLDDAKSTTGVSQSNASSNPAVVANPSSTISSSSPKPMVQSSNVEANVLLPQNESSSNPVGVASSPSLKPTIQPADVEPAIVSQNGFPGVALPNSIQQNSDGKTTVDAKPSTNDVDQTRGESSTVNLSDVESVLPEISSKTVAAENIHTPKPVATQRQEVLSSIPEGSLSPKASVVGAQSENLGRKDITAVPANELPQPAEPSSLTSSLLASNSKPAATSDAIKLTAELIPSENSGNRVQENRVNITSSIAEPVSLTVPLSAEASDVVLTAPIKNAVVSVSKEASLERTPSAAQASVAVLPEAAGVISSSTEASIVVPQMVIGETSLNGSLPLAGFELTESGVSPAISEMVQSPSPAGATTQPVVEPDLHIDEVAKTLSPTLAATKAEGDDFDLAGLRQPPVRSTDSSVVLPQGENNGNRVVAAVPSSPASPSLKPTGTSG